MLQIEPIAAFSDNYIWLLYDSAERAAWVIDPGDAQPVLRALAEKKLPLAGILITHHHSDHIGGLAALCAQFDVPVYGPVETPSPAISQRLREGDTVRAAGRKFSVLTIPGHTLDHIAYFSAVPEPLLFCGDTLFAGGCGRVFEGTMPMMHASLQKLAQLPAATRVYCAHEYTLSNLRFALAVEPVNTALQQRQQRDQRKREQARATVPSTLAIELATNPFLRCTQGDVRAAAEKRAGHALASDAEVFGALRDWKDRF